MGLTAGNQRYSSQLTWREKLVAKMAMGGKLPGCTCREVCRDDRVFLSLNSFTYTILITILHVIRLLRLPGASLTFMSNCVAATVNNPQ